MKWLEEAMASTIASMAEPVKAATEWWAEKLRHVAVFDNGDPSAVGGMTAILAMAVSARNPAPTEDMLAAFQCSLAERLMARCVSSWRWDQPEWASYQRTVHVDYGPDPILSAACEDAGIQHADSRFPCKTTMWIDPGKVQVAEGYGKGPVTIYPSQAIEIRIGPDDEEAVQRFIEENKSGKAST